MCPELELIALVGIFGGAVWYSFKFMKYGIIDIYHGVKCQDIWIALKGGGIIVAIPLIFVGILVGGLLVIEMFYMCQ